MGQSDSGTGTVESVKSTASESQQVKDFCLPRERMSIPDDQMVAGPSGHFQPTPRPTETGVRGKYGNGN